MKARILFLGDLHKRDVDFTTIKGYTTAVDMVQADILSFIKDKGVTHLVSLGDWYDKGYRSINRCANDRNFDEELAAAVNGNFYICLGNHFFLERDNNPEMYLIQPSELHKPTHAIYAKKPVIQAPAYFRVGSVQVSLFHYHKTNKDYRATLDPSVKYHIGVYHDEIVVPTYAQKAGGLINGTPAQNVQAILDNVNFAIVGHIHKPVGYIKVPMGDRDVPMFIPGSLANTSNGPQFHESVNLPVVDIDDDDKVSCSLFTFSLHCEVLKLYQRKEGAIQAELPTQVVTDIPKTVSLKEFLLAKGYTDEPISLVEEAAERQVTALRGLQILGIIKEKQA